MNYLLQNWRVNRGDKILIEVQIALMFVVSFLYGCFFTSYLYEIRKPRQRIVYLSSGIVEDTQERPPKYYWLYVGS